MIPKQKNFAYIDGANLHKGIGDLGWKLDYRRFRVWLREKYSVEKAYFPRKKCSWLLRKTNAPIVCLGEMESKLRKNEKAPGTDGTVQGPLSW